MSFKRVAVAYYRTLSSQSSASLTAGYLTAHLREKGFSVTIFQLELTDQEHDIALLAESDPQIVFYKPNFQDVHRLNCNLRALSARLPSVSIGLFGPFAALNAECLLQEHGSVRGILVPNHEYLAGNHPEWWMGDSESAPVGVISRTPGGISIVAAEPRDVEENAYRLRPARDIELQEPIVIANIEASRGCVRRCSFCHIPTTAKLGGAPILHRPVADVLDEMEKLYDSGKRYFIFNDSIMGGGGTRNGVEWLEEFAQRVRANAREMLFMGYFTLDYVEKNSVLINSLAGAGLVRVFVGIEAATPGPLRVFQKAVAVHRYSEVKAWLRERFVLPHIGFMLFHPFASPNDILSGIDFLHKNDEIHRFATIREAARLVPGTKLLRDAVSAGLTLPLVDQCLPYSYRFANLDTQRIHERMQTAWDMIGLPVLERLEHLFVTGLFIENLVRRRGQDESEFTQVASGFHEARSRYGELFSGLARRLCSNDAAIWAEPKIFGRLLDEVEQRWSSLLAAAAAAGLDSPLTWVTTGDLCSEIKRSPDYDGRSARTRSGYLHHSSREFRC